jgi:hypothetical protein
VTDDALIAFLNARLAEAKARAEDPIVCEPIAVKERTLREVTAKRAIIARYEDCLIRIEDDDYPAGPAADQAREYEDFVLPNLAAVDCDHPDYKPEWKP